ncbi:MAG: cobyric acid synthase [Deltaproteobacteria bacterium]|nr:cobyric acid synthase [Deltaproteobacteria bacterium]
MSWRHGGDVKSLARKTGKAVEELLDFSANINPLGPPAWLPERIASLIGSLVHYPDPHCRALVQAIAEFHSLPEEEIVAANGSSEIFYLLPRILGAKRALIPVPAYGDYAVASSLAGLTVEKMPLRESNDFVLDLRELEGKLKGDEAVFLGQPGNPTGYLCNPDDLRDLAARHPKTTFIIDEAFADFIEGLDHLAKRRPANMVVVRSLTKFYAIPGLRLGYAVANPETAQRLRELIPPWSVNTFAQAVGEKALRDRGYETRTRRVVRGLREGLSARLRNMPGLTLYPGNANFLLVRIDRKDLDARELARRMLQEGIAIRVCDNMDGLDERFFRMAVRTEAENLRFCDALEDRMKPAGDRLSVALPAGGLPGVVIPFRHPRRTPAVMFQGTCSHAGKSILTAAMCRILLDDGYRVAPFKAQNMSLNSFVTRGGGEIGRAQAVQAQACRIEPDVRMNPLLLKPSTDTGSQVIRLGKPVGNMDFAEYTRHHAECLDIARDAYDSLAQEYDVIVLEGAGSPAEVNLMNHDIANMKTAHYAHAPVLLVGNIDRGGVYASFIGTMEVLGEAERSLVAGFIVNRFRGTAALLDNAHAYILERTGLPVIGVVPELAGLGLPEEDSVGFREGLCGAGDRDEDSVDVAVVDFAHISNFTDYDPLRIESDVRVRIVRSPRELGTPDAVILPGSKNVVADLTFLRESGLAEGLLSLLGAGRTEIIGICGGFQMLGAEIADPHGIESAGKTVPGLRLLPLTTVLAPDKLLMRTSATHLASGLDVTGYEIHHGLTDGMAALPVMRKSDGTVIGAGAPDGRVWGTYLHGVFDADGFRRWFIDRLRVGRGLVPRKRIGAAYDLEPAFDRLAQAVRSGTDIDSIYRIMGLR